MSGKETSLAEQLRALAAETSSLVNAWCWLERSAGVINRAASLVGRSGRAEVDDHENPNCKDVTGRP